MKHINDDTIARRLAQNFENEAVLGHEPDNIPFEMLALESEMRVRERARLSTCIVKATPMRMNSRGPAERARAHLRET
eukprot:9409086-Pyramimonas_sp.AAC.1